MTDHHQWYSATIYDLKLNVILKVKIICLPRLNIPSRSSRISKIILPTIMFKGEGQAPSPGLR